jgi:hypothetical protein
MKNIYKIGENIYITNDSYIRILNYVVVSCSEVNIEEVRIVTGYCDEQILFDDSSKIHMDYCKKIILTTDQKLFKDGYGVQSIENDFLEWLVNNPSCEEVEIEEEYYSQKCFITLNKINYKIITPQEELKQVPIENDEFCYYSGLPSPAAYKEDINPFELSNVLPDDVFNKSLEEDAEKEYPKLIVENPSCNGYNEPNHIDINEECRNAFMEGVKSDKAKEMWIKSKEAEIYWHKKFNDNKYKS